MGKRGTSRAWLWILLAVVLAGIIGYFITSKNDKGPEEPLITEKLASLDEKSPLVEYRNTDGEKEETLPFLTVDGPTAKSPSTQKYKVQNNLNETYSTKTENSTKKVYSIDAKEDHCIQIEKNVMEFFRYLDEKEYMSGQNLNIDTYTRFKKILNRLASQTPIPAGEATDTKAIIRNIFHFYRILGRKDLRLIRDILSKEEDTLEYNFEMFYKWFGLRCPKPEGLRPSMEILYRYAGFLINSTGGRACLFRRSQEVRLLISYYCLLIVHDADKKGINNYGIDILPLIKPLRNEISYYPAFQFQEKYIEQLNRLQYYYWQKR